jgi:hypothetical protein
MKCSQCESCLRPALGFVAEGVGCWGLEKSYLTPKARRPGKQLAGAPKISPQKAAKSTPT